MLYGENKNSGQNKKSDVPNKAQEKKLQSEDKQTDRLKPVRDMWSNTNPKNKRRIVIACLILIAIFVILAGYKFSGRSFSGGDEEKAVAQNKTREINIDQDMVEKGLYESNQNQIDHQNDEIAKIKSAILKLKETPPVVVNEVISANAGTSGRGSSCPTKNKISIPPPPPVNQPATKQGAKSMYAPPPPPPIAVEQGFMGGISFVSNSEPLKKQDNKGKKKENQEVYLPPSFMEAILLSGLAAPTTSVGKNNPQPILMRVKDLAVLPNKVKANLKGCFLIAEGVGNLADERVHARLVTLSCISREGSSIIDQAIKGFIVDGDGKVGLKGMVTAKMGAMLARSALTGFLGGMGDALDQSSMTNSFSAATGTNQEWLTDTDASNIARAGVGKGISNAMGDLQKFYLQLAEQTMPVIEVGANKTVTAVVSEGIMLKIKDYNSDPGE